MYLMVDRNNSLTMDNILKTHGSPDFRKLVLGFFKSCCYPLAKNETFMLARLTKINIDDGGKSSIKGAIVLKRNGPVTGNTEHFLTWLSETIRSNKKEESKFFYESIELWINNSPCGDCAKKLNQWLSTNKDLEIKLKINYAYFYTGGNKTFEDYIDDPLSCPDVIELEKLMVQQSVPIVKISNDTFATLLKEFCPY
ncbi:uncharacterized protein LOC125501100 [Athalia rosae]|uniref:uncharacterized protein LOC125501100 n=1 Tax=Athalia rosae TaxID=37344 RepID=UPI002033FF81|nr:uncharacterized protein LOC125501100 [Athalia rosae]